MQKGQAVQSLIPIDKINIQIKFKIKLPTLSQDISLV